MKSLNYKSRVLKRQNSKEYIDYLINCAKEGDEDAKLNLIDAYSGLVINSIKKYCPIWKEYDDLYQDGISVLLYLVNLYNPQKASFSTFAMNYLSYYYKKTFDYLIKCDNSLNNTIEEDGEIFDIFDTIKSDVSIESDLICKEKFHTISDGLNLLTKRQKEVINLYYFKGLSHKKIAEKLDISTRTVINTKFRAIEILRRFIDDFREVAN